MENKINTKLDQHQLLFKQSIKSWMADNKANVSINGQDKTSEFLQFIFDFNNMSINKEDLRKRTRVKNVVPQCELCIAKIADGTQCTRRKQLTDTTFCGTHIKGQPYGIETFIDNALQTTHKVNIWVEEINGIHYYIDNVNNVYKHEDIISNIVNPAIVANWALTETGAYYLTKICQKNTSVLIDIAVDNDYSKSGLELCYNMV